MRRNIIILVVLPHELVLFTSSISLFTGLAQKINNIIILKLFWYVHIVQAIVTTKT